MTRAYQENDWIKVALLKLRTGALKMKSVPLAELEERDGRVYFQQDRLVVPKDDDLRLRILRLAHDSPNAGHPGKTKQFEIIRRSYWRPGLVVSGILRWNCDDQERARIGKKLSGAITPRAMVSD